MLNLIQFLQINRLISSNFPISLITFLGLFTLNISPVSQAQTVENKNNQIALYGTEENTNTIGAEYLLFENNQEDSARGLVFVKNSDVFSCFQASYDHRNKSLKEVIFAYPEGASDQMVTNKSEEKIALKDFPHQLNYVDTNKNTQQLFNKCLTYFENS